MTLTFKLELNSVKMNQRAKTLDQRSFRSKVTARTNTQTHTGPTALSGPLMWSVTVIITIARLFARAQS